MDLVIQAAQFALDAHSGQRRKYNGRPYIFHPGRVASLAMIFLEEPTQAILAACWTHDVIEDCGVTFEELEETLNREVANLVQELTNPSRESDAPRADRKKMDREHLAHVSDAAKLIKALDRLDNLWEMEGATGEFKELYAEESEALLEVLEPALPELIVEMIEEAIDALLAKEETDTTVA
jgi:(p)ppGpp synthase/HD superfamily hydrolase